MRCNHMKQYTPEEIEDAILILEICSQNDTTGTLEVSRELDVPRSTTLLARRAFTAIDDDIMMSGDTCYLEAAALLRDGWLLGDPIEVL